MGYYPDTSFYRQEAVHLSNNLDNFLCGRSMFTTGPTCLEEMSDDDSGVSSIDAASDSAHATESMGSGTESKPEPEHVTKRSNTLPGNQIWSTTHYGC